MAMRQIMLCHWCDRDAVTWIDWCVHEIPRAYGSGGGALMAYIPLCRDHAELIAEAQEYLRSLFS
jgi:hypothetical protein